MSAHINPGEIRAQRKLVRDAKADRRRIGRKIRRGQIIRVKKGDSLALRSV